MQVEIYVHTDGGGESDDLSTAVDDNWVSLPTLVSFIYLWGLEPSPNRLGVLLPAV